MVSPFFGLAGINNNSTSIKEDDRKREFENCIGNLLVAEYQVFRLRERIKNYLSGSIDGLMESEFMFKMGSAWFRINVSAQKQEEMKEAEGGDDGQGGVKEGQSTGFALPENVAAAIVDDEEPNEEYTAMP